MVTQGRLAFFFHNIGCQGYNKLLQNTAVTSPDHSGIVLHLAITCSKSHLIQHLNPEGTLGSILLWVNQVNKFDIKGENTHWSYQTYKVSETGIATLPEIKHLNISGKRWESADANYIILKYNLNPNQWKLNQSRTSSTFRANITFPTAIISCAGQQLLVKKNYNYLQMSAALCKLTKWDKMAFKHSKG